MTYKESFDDLLEAYTDMKNQEMTSVDIAMDFLWGLDNNRHGKFKTNLLNDLLWVIWPSKSLNDVYSMVSKVILPKPAITAYRAAFATKVDEERTEHDETPRERHSRHKFRGRESAASPMSVNWA